MKPKHLFLALPAVLFFVGNGVANAGQTINDVGAIACVNDKLDVKEPEKGHKLIDYAGRCVNIPDDPAAPKSTAECVGKYEYMPDESWKGSGTCTYTYKGGEDTLDRRLGRRVGTSKNILTRTPVARAQTKALVVV